MNLLHFIETLGIGGAETQLAVLLPELARNGNKVSVAVLRGPLDLGERLEASGVPVTILAPHHKWNLIAGARNIAKIARGLEADIVHAHLYFPALYTGLARIFRLMPSHTCVTFHNLAYQAGANRPGLKLAFRRLLARWIYRHGIDRFFSVSAASAEHYRQALGISDISVIHNPIDLDAVSAAEKAGAERGTRSKAKEALIVLPGRLVHEKGHNCFIRALALLRDDGLSFRAILAGDGPLRGVIEQQISSVSLEDRIEITGTLPHEDLLRLVAGADIVAVPSLFEGFGLTALEGSALGRPVVAANVGGLPEIIEDEVTGLLVPPNDPAQLAAALKRLAGDRKLRLRFGKAGRERAAKCFALPGIAKTLAEHYHEVVMGSRPGG